MNKLETKKKTNQNKKKKKKKKKKKDLCKGTYFPK